MGWYFLQQGDLQKAVFHVLIGSFIVVLPVTCLIYSFRRWTVVASPERLTITRRWPLGTNAMTFDATEIKRICIEANGIKIGNCPHHQLVIHTHQKKNAVKLMSSWRIKELKYAAAMIYRALKITPTTDST